MKKIITALVATTMLTSAANATAISNVVSASNGADKVNTLNTHISGVLSALAAGGLAINSSSLAGSGNGLATSVTSNWTDDMGTLLHMIDNSHEATYFDVDAWEYVEHDGFTVDEIVAQVNVLADGLGEDVGGYVSTMAVQMQAIAIEYDKMADGAAKTTMLTNMKALATETRGAVVAARGLSTAIKSTITSTTWDDFKIRASATTYIDNAVATLDDLVFEHDGYQFTCDSYTQYVTNGCIKVKLFNALVIGSNTWNNIASQDNLLGALVSHNNWNHGYDTRSGRRYTFRVTYDTTLYAYVVTQESGQGFGDVTGSYTSHAAARDAALNAINDVGA